MLLLENETTTFVAELTLGIIVCLLLILTFIFCCEKKKNQAVMRSFDDMQTDDSAVFDPLKSVSDTNSKNLHQFQLRRARNTYYLTFRKI